VTEVAGLDAQGWLRRWDDQQAGYHPGREQRFDAMLELVEAVCGPAPRVVDLACGPGAIASRLLARLPDASVVAVDRDPVLLALGRAALGDCGGRLEWVDADLRDRAWLDALDGPVDAVLSTTALHWLAAPELVQLAHRLAGAVRPGGVVLDGDALVHPASRPVLRDVSARVRQLRSSRRQGAESWEDWWAGIRAEPAFADAVAERDRRDAEHPHGHGEASLPLYVAAFLDAGFADAGVVWSDHDDRVLLAVR